MKINQLEIENVKRVKAVKLEPSKDGLTIIGGRNGQGEPWRVSPFDDEDEAPLIDVPEGSDEPDYGPEKIPPRTEE